MFKKIAALGAAAALSVGLMTGCGASSTTADTSSYSAENPLVLTLAHGLSETHTVHIAMTHFLRRSTKRPVAASRSKSSPTASSAARTRILSSCRPALSP